ncbi:MAG: lysoplasmalogenase [Pirellulaceae bacterium]|nr:lysoplasmalogenase [Pirellulaceae bacterium]
MHVCPLQQLKEPSLSIALAEIRTALRPLLACLWVAWAAVLLGPMIWDLIAGAESYRTPGWCKMTSSVLLIIAGWTWYAALVGTDSDADSIKRAKRIALLMTAGMALGTLGDFFNAGRLQEVIPLDDPTVGGLASFLLGHILYITACILLARWCELTDRRSWLLAVGFWQFAAVIGWVLICFRGEGNATLMWAALPYSMLLAGTAGVTAALALQDKRLTLLAMGGALFLISDLILGYEIFQGPLWPEGEPVWLTYGPGQMLIVFAIGAMVTLLPDDE